MPDRHGATSNAGASALAKGRRLHERRMRAAPERGAAARLLRALTGPSPEERRLTAEEHAWITGARGEQRLARSLSRRCPGVPLLHDRRVPGSRANIDHIAVAPSGVYVIDAKRYRGKIAVESPMFGSQRLRIAGRDRTSLIAGLERQVITVKGVLRELEEDVPVHGCICFVAPEGVFGEVELPLLRTLRINGFPLYYARRLARQLRSAGPIGPDHARRLQTALASRLPPAVS